MEEKSMERFGINNKGKLTLDKYLDFLRSRDDSLLTVSDLQQIISIQCLRKSFRGTKTSMMEALSQTSLMDPSRSTLGLSNIRPAAMKLDDILKDIAELDWQECPVAYVRTINSVQYSTDSSNSPTDSIITSLAAESTGSEKKMEKGQKRSSGGSWRSDGVIRSNGKQHIMCDLVESEESEKKMEKGKGEKRYSGGSCGRSDGVITGVSNDGDRSNGEQQIIGALVEFEGSETKKEKVKKRYSGGSDGRTDDGWIVVGGRDRSSGEQVTGALAEAELQGSEIKQKKVQKRRLGENDGRTTAGGRDGDCSGASAVVHSWFSPLGSVSKLNTEQRKKTNMRPLHPSTIEDLI